MSEKNAVEPYKGLEVSMARDLLQEKGYGMSCRFGHVHATRGGEEWHVCLIADLVLMNPSHFLVCLDESIKGSLQGVAPLLNRVL